MAQAAVQAAASPTREDFAKLIDKSFGDGHLQEGAVVKGTVVAIERDLAVIDVGLKTEGRVALREFAGPGRSAEIKVGDTVEVYLERIENALGEAVLSRDKARREESWGKLEKAFQNNEKVQGIIFNQVKGGFTVDLDGAVAFLPRSQVDIRPIRDVSPLMNNPQPFQILKMDRRRGNIVVSRRTVLEETRAEQRQELVQNLEEGQVIDGVVKNITDYGAFVDLGGIDGLLHVTDIAWRRVNHPSEVLNIGQQVKVKIIKINHETHRISLGMKQLLDDPWQGIEAKYPVGARFKGRVTNITDYGAFVELEPGIEGLIHVSEMSWTKKNVHPGKIVSTSQEVEVQVLEVDPVKRRISLGLKQTMRNPWEVFVEKYPAGSVVEGEVKNKTEFGLFLGLDGDVDGMVHLSDLDWKRPGEQVIEEYKKGDKVKAQVLDVDIEKERISLGIKQLAGGSARRRRDCRRRAQEGRGRHLRGDRGEGRRHRREDRRHRVRCLHQAFGAGARSFRAASRIALPSARRSMPGSSSSIAARGKVSVSIKALEVAEEKEAIAQYGSSDSGATLGDILGTALKRKGEEDETRKERGNGEGRRRGVTGDRPGLVTIGETQAKESETMSLDADLIVDRRRMRRKLTFWRVLAIVVSLLGRRRAWRRLQQSLGVFGGVAYIARVTIRD